MPEKETKLGFMYTVNTNNQVHVLTTDEAAFFLRVTTKDFKNLFVYQGKIKHRYYNEQRGGDLYLLSELVELQKKENEGVKFIDTANISLTAGREFNPNSPPPPSKFQGFQEKIDFDALTYDINHISPEQLAQHGVITPAKKRVGGKDTYICPVCGNGSGSDGDGMTTKEYSWGWNYQCYKENQGYNNIELLAMYYGLDVQGKDFVELCKRAANDFLGYNFDIYGYSSLTEKEIAEMKAARDKRRAELEQAAAEKAALDAEIKSKQLPLIQQTIATVKKTSGELTENERRGIPANYFKEFNCGIIQNWIHPKTIVEKELGLRDNLPFPTRRLIIPTVDGLHYNAILSPADRNENNKSFWKMHAGEKDKCTFGLQTLSAGNEVIFVTEGEIDALSMFYAWNDLFLTCTAEYVINAGFIAILGAAATAWYEELEKVFGSSSKKPLVIFVADNDDTGRTQAEKHRTELLRRGYPAFINYFSDGAEKVDANDILKNQDVTVLRQFLEQFYTDAQNNLLAVQAALIAEQEKAEAEKTAAELKDKIADFETRKGKIEPKTLEELKAAVDYIKSLTADNLNSANATNSKTVDALALCTYYDFYQSVAADFLSRVTTARNLAKAQVKAATDDNPADISVQNMARVGLSEIKDAISKEVTVVKSKHADYNKRQEQEQARIEWQRKQKQAQNKLQRSLEKLNGLIKQPQTPERDNNIVNLILDNCDWRLGKYGEKISVKPTQANYDLIFTYDPVLSGLIGYDEFKAAVVFLRKPIWDKSVEIFDTWTDSDDSNALVYLRQTYTDIPGDNIFLDNLIYYATKNRFNAVKEYFEKLPKWDGTKRAETLFIDFLKIEDTPFARAVTIKWLLAAVSRIFHPACTFQAALVLQGNQNIGKSYILERLGGKWYGSLLDSVDDTHAVDAIKQLWIVELKEMAAARKSEINATKAFIERGTDTHRAAYARNAETFKRHCVFAITVNDKQFLRDMTGNRRYWILESPLPEFDYQEGLTDDIVKQVWAEVYAMFKGLTVDGFNDKILELPLEFKQQAEIIAKRFTADDGLQSEIAAFLEIPIPKPIIWNLLTPSEKRKYFEHTKLEMEDGELYKRSKILKDAEAEEFDAEYEKLDKREIPTGKDSAPNLVDVLRGRYYRQETCASEIYHEYFYGSDKRKQIYKITESLDQLDGWELVDDYRVKNFNGYGDQKKIYRRTIQTNFEESAEEPYQLPDADVPF